MYHADCQTMILSRFHEGATPKTLSPFYHNTDTMDGIGSTSYVLPIELSYRWLNGVIRVASFKTFVNANFTGVSFKNSSIQVSTSVTLKRVSKILFENDGIRKHGNK